MAHQILRINGLADPAAGTTVTPTVTSSGITINTVPASATIRIDVRAMTQEEQMRVDAGLRDLAPVLQGSRLELTGGPDRPPLPTSASAELFERASEIALRLGLQLEGAIVGGGSDGNLAAAVGTPTLDGVGAVGGNAHAEGEYVSVPAMPERAALVAELAKALLWE
jgi:glutamate carboxypeptidase